MCYMVYKKSHQFDFLNMETEKVTNDKSMSEVLRSLAESSSWHGIPKIASSPQRTVKCLWCILMLGAFAFMLWQLSELFTTFRSHPVQTIVSLEFSSHRFPAVTFCNLNPVRKSQIALSPELANVLYTRKNRATSVMVTKTSSATGPVTRSTTLPSPTTTSFTKSTRPITSLTTSSFSDSNVTDLQQFKNQTGMNDTFDESDLFTEEHYMNQSVFEKEFEENNSIDNSDESEIDEREQWEEVTRTFMTKFRNESVTQSNKSTALRMPTLGYRNLRKRMGHQKEDFISRATFGKEQQNVTQHFTEFTSSDYGNCFTMESPKYIAVRSGPDHGIKLRLNLEVDEYIKNFASGYGVRMVFHEPGTFAMPAEEGLTLSPGHETMIGLRVVNISRLDYPFGNCTDGEDFKLRYNVSYSVASCMEFCRVKMTIEACNCKPFDAPDLDFSRTELHVCDNLNRNEDECADKVNYNFEPGRSKCDCISPCRETVYEKTISGRRWPNKDYLEKVLMADTCGRNMSSMKEACSQLKNKTFDYERYRYNFIRARIYFEELNYQQITEQEAYKPVRFVSDIGGAMGLFLGASLLSILELFQLILEVVLHARKPKQTLPSEASVRRQQQQNGNFSPV